jgi:hypothetical protein
LASEATRQPFALIGASNFLELADWRGGYVLLTIGAGEPESELIRVDCDIKRAMAGIRESELPDEFAEALPTGGAPGSPLEYKIIPENAGEAAE